MNVNDYIAHETERQSGTIREALGMCRAWRDWSDRKPGLVTESMLMGAASFINGQTGYRKVPAVFDQGMPALEASLIPRAMGNLFEYVERETPGYALSVNDFADYVTKEFLLIHPFADGNGRVGSLLWNFLRGTINDPEPMPYFFGEQ
jgi:hypothetical protein